MSHADSSSQSFKIFGRTLTEWCVSLPTISMLLLVLVISTGELVHGRLLAMGEALFGDPAHQVQYYSLRGDLPTPDCNPNVNIDAELRRMEAESKATGGGDSIDDLFEAQAFDPAKARQSLTDSIAECKFKHEWVERSRAHITPAVKAFRSVETAFFGLFRFGTDNRSMILLILMGVVILASTWEYEHIGLVPVRYKRDYTVQALTTLVAGGFMLWSSVMYYRISGQSGVPMENAEHQIAWIVMFAIMVLISLWQLAKPPKLEGVEDGSWLRASQTAPIGGTLAITAGVYFLLHDHPAGLSIYINTLMEIPSIPLQLALFIWGGMLFKQSRMVDLFMNLMRPWKLSPEALTFFVLLAAAVPTAYTGGSGAFVMAAGAIIYHEIRAVGGSSQFALGATAMSGSLGVVLSPSLLVVAIVAVNRQVTSSELFHYGLLVFALMSVLFFIGSQLRREKHTIDVAKPSQAFPIMLQQIPPLLPHIAVVAAVILFFTVGLKTNLNENTAPTIMPIMMILIVMADKWMQARGIGQPKIASPYVMPREDKIESSIRVATNETVGHLGSYMFLILLSQAIGGVIERSQIITLFPAIFSSVTVCMAFLVIVLIVVGMFMEPLGAIFLISGTLAPIAYKNGIDPIHFWVTVLVSFEVGYLMPPVALNQLLARQVVGDDVMRKADAEVAHLSFYRRYERWVLPNAVMTVGLVFVAFGPLMTKTYPQLHQWILSLIGFVPK